MSKTDKNEDFEPEELEEDDDLDGDLDDDLDDLDGPDDDLVPDLDDDLDDDLDGPPNAVNEDDDEDEEDDDEDDDEDEELEGYCPSCEDNTIHTISVDERTEKKVATCNKCDKTHTYKKPRAQKPLARPSGVNAGAKPLDAAEAAKRWKKLSKTLSDVEARPYSIKEPYKVDEAVHHVKFGRGYVIRICTPTKIEVVFEDCSRLLVCNRGGS